MKSLFLSISLLLAAPLVVSAPYSQQQSASETTVKDHWVKSLLQGVAAGAWPDSPVKLHDGRVFFNDGQIEQVTGKTATALNYNHTNCPSMNGAFGLVATSSDQLVVGFNPVNLHNLSPWPVMGRINPDNGDCQVITDAPADAYMFVALTIDHNDNLYYALAAGAVDTFQFFKYSKAAGSTQLFTVTGNMPDDIAVDSKGNVYASWYSLSNDPYHNQVTVWKPSTGKMTVYAGNGNTGKSPDGTLATESALGDLYGIAIDKNDNLYIAQEDNPNRISMVDAKTGKIYHFAGNGLNLYVSRLGLGLHTGMCPRGMAFTPEGNLIYTDIRAYLGLFSDIRLIEMPNSDSFPEQWDNRL